MTGTIEVERLYPRRPLLPPTVETEPRREYILPEEQEKAAETVKSIASKCDLEVEVVDFGRENVLRRVIQEEREKIRIFPTLMTDSGRRIEGEMTAEKIELFLSQIARKRRKAYL